MGAHFETFDLRFDKKAKKAKKVEVAAVIEPVAEEKPADTSAELLAQLQALLANN